MYQSYIQRILPRYKYFIVLKLSFLSNKKGSPQFSARYEWKALAIKRLGRRLTYVYGSKSKIH